MTDLLIRFKYDFYCQGYDDAVETVLVKKVFTFEEACAKIKKKYLNARDFEDLTLS